MLYPLGRASLGSAGASVSNLKPLVLVELFAAANINGQDWRLSRY